MSNVVNETAIRWWIKFYGVVVLLAGIYGIVVAHLPVILGHQWSVCLIDGKISIPCVLTIHLYDAVLTILLMVFSWYSIYKMKMSQLKQYMYLLVFVVAVEIAFFTFEAVELLWNFHNNAASWENYIIASIAVILLGGFTLGIYVHQKISSLSDS